MLYAEFELTEIRSTVFN